MGLIDKATGKGKQLVGDLSGSPALKEEGIAQERRADEQRPDTSHGRRDMSTQQAGLGGRDAPVSDTIHNLVQTLSVKLDSSHRYGLYQQDALKDGYEDVAEVFGDIAARERETIDRLVRCLQDYIGEAAAGTGAQPGADPLAAGAVGADPAGAPLAGGQSPGVATPGEPEAERPISVPEPPTT
jgi:hypothetical protein